MMFRLLKELAISQIERFPLSYYLGKRVPHHLSFLLPHDQNYLGLRHLTSNQDGLFLDIGANDGISALSFRSLDQRYRILSVEPNPFQVKSLDRVKAKIANFDYILKAAGRNFGSFKLHIPYHGRIPLHSYASLEYDTIIENIARIMPARVSNQVSIRSIKVEVIPLDSLNLTPSIIKIDAEGADHDVLLGLSKTIAQTRPYLMVESTNEHLINNFETFFGERNYDLMNYDFRTDRFSHFQKTRLRNIYAIPQERQKSYNQLVI